jgi:RNA polymerase sigma-70 factor (ECF subfamily)
MDHPGSAPTPERQVINKERRQRLFAVLDNLDDAKRELILLRFGAELTYQEIGEIVGKREAAVKMAIYRLLDELRGVWHLSVHEASGREETHE